MLGFFVDPNKANSACALLISISSLLGSGFLRSVESMPVILRYLSYSTFHRYSSEILVANEYVGLELSCDPYVPCLYKNGEEYIDVSVRLA